MAWLKGPAARERVRQKGGGHEKMDFGTLNFTECDFGVFVVDNDHFDAGGVGFIHLHVTYPIKTF